jgi:tetratricopeptide (TPR) repeat protein
LGLVARLTGEEAIIHDPSGRTSTDELRDLVLREAVSGWRRVLLRAPDAKRQAYGHFALGLLYEHQNDHASAMTEYRLVTERYPRSKHAPQARLRGAIVRIDFRDFTGAREELIELLNRHPSFPDSDQVYLRLGQATMETGHLDEAIKTFKKLFYLELSQESRIGACLGAGTCFYRKGDHKSAAEWLARYVALARQSDTEAGAARGSLLLARSLNALGRHQDAVAAVRKAADAEADTDLRTELLLELARSLAAGKEYTAALAVVHRVEASDVDRPALDEAALIQSRVLRAISVPERALRLLREELRHAADARTKARMAVELARCYADAGDLDGARRIMAEALPKLEAGPEAHEATCELADFALRAGHPDQTIGLCRKLLARPISPEVRRRAFEALGQAYVAVRDYERAALAFSGAMPGAKGGANP